MGNQYPWYTHSILYRSIKLEFSLKAEEPLRIGAGRSPPLALTDLPVITININGEITPYIPGSSLKGTLRSVCELLVKSAGLDSCMAGSCAREKKVGDENLLSLMDTAMRTNNIQLLLTTLEKFCLICKIFGAGSYKAHIDFREAYPQKDTVRTSIKSGIAINRRSGAVKRGALFQVEYVEPGAIFNTSIVMTNLPNYVVGLLLVALDMVNEGLFKLGGFKSKGFGKVSVIYLGLSGLVFEDGVSRRLEDIAKLRGLDAQDGDVYLDSKDLASTLQGFRKKWSEYVQKVRSS